MGGHRPDSLRSRLKDAQLMGKLVERPVRKKRVLWCFRVVDKARISAIMKQLHGWVRSHPHSRIGNLGLEPEIWNCKCSIIALITFSSKDKGMGGGGMEKVVEVCLKDSRGISKLVPRRLWTRRTLILCWGEYLLMWRLSYPKITNQRNTDQFKTITINGNDLICKTEGTFFGNNFLQ